MLNANKPRSYPFVVLAGSLAAVALLAALRFTHQGLLGFLPYAALLIAFVLYFRRNRIAFRERFGAALLAYAIPSVTSFVYVVMVANPIVLQHPWVIARTVGIMLLIGLLAGGAVAALTRLTRVAA